MSNRGSFDLGSRSAIIFSQSDWDSAISICSKDCGAIGDHKFKDRKCDFFFAVIAFCLKYEVNYCKIAEKLN